MQAGIHVEDPRRADDTAVRELVADARDAAAPGDLHLDRAARASGRVRAATQNQPTAIASVTSGTTTSPKRTIQVRWRRLTFTAGPVRATTAASRPPRPCRRPAGARRGARAPRSSARSAVTVVSRSSCTTTSISPAIARSGFDLGERGAGGRSGLARQRQRQADDDHVRRRPRGRCRRSRGGRPRDRRCGAARRAAMRPCGTGSESASPMRRSPRSTPSARRAGRRDHDPHCAASSRATASASSMPATF